MLRHLYERLLSEETRYWLYKLRHPDDFRRLRTTTFPSEKGDFSLRGFDENQCIFVHITKTAGTSVALSLFGELPYHYTASQYRVIYGRKTFNSYFKFCFVRNPWDRLYSAYRYLKAGGWNESDKRWSEEHLEGVEDYEDFVMRWLDADRLLSHIHFWPQSRFICDSRGKIIVDYAGRFETLADDFQRIAREINAGASLASKNRGTPADSYTAVYTPAMRQKVAQLYADDISLLGYSFSDFSDTLPKALPAVARSTR